MRNSQRRIERRLGDKDWEDQPGPMFRGGNIQYEIAERARGLTVGGIGLMQKMVQDLGLPARIDERLELLKVHLPYFESDHVLNIAYNSLVGGKSIEDIELRRNDEVFLDALGTERIPDPTTAGDFCRRFAEEDVEALLDAINETRLEVWKKQPEEFFDEAFLDGDGTLAPTSGECKEGMGISYKGDWGYHPLIVSLANTQEPLFLSNRSGNRPSPEGAASRFDRAIDLCRRAGFRKITLRGDTDFSQSEHLDRWHDAGVGFLFGYDSTKGLQKRALELEESAWKPLERRAKYRVKTKQRQRPENVKKRIVKERGYKNRGLEFEHVAEFRYRPTASKRSYRMIVLRKNISVQKGEFELFDDVRYFFFITDDMRLSPRSLVFKANDRCNQENLIEQLKNGVHAMRMPVDNLVSNWAYMVMASLAWSLKAWLALSLPERGRWNEKYKTEKASVLRMEFRKFVDEFVRIPVQLVKTGRRLVFRLLAWNRYQHVFIRAVECFETPLRC